MRAKCISGHHNWLPKYIPLLWAIQHYVVSFSCVFGCPKIPRWVRVDIIMGSPVTRTPVSLATHSDTVTVKSTDCGISPNSMDQVNAFLFSGLDFVSHLSLPTETSDCPGIRGSGMKFRLWWWNLPQISVVHPVRMYFSSALVYVPNKLNKARMVAPDPPGKDPRGTSVCSVARRTQLSNTVILYGLASTNFSLQK